MQTEPDGAPTALDTLTMWRQLLVELGDTGDALCAAIEAGEVVAGIATMMQLRRIRSELARVEHPARLRADSAEITAMSEVTTAMVRARGAEAAMASWLARELPPDAVLRRSALGVAILADSMLPPVWDFETDLVVLAGPGLEPVAQLLADVGQRRIVMLNAKSPVAIVVESDEELVTALRTLVPLPPTQFVLRAASADEAAEAEHLVDVVRSALQDLRIHRNTVREFSRTWIEQGMANLTGLGGWPSVAALDAQFAGKPMIIIAPGPSLAKNIDQVRALKGRAVIVAFSHSLKAVLAAGIEPDLVMTVDPQDVRYHFEGCDLGGACLVNAATVHPALFELPAERMLTLSANCAVDDWIFDAVGEHALVPGGGSVATSAFALALRWRCEPIVYVGLDLSFPGGEYYVATSSDGNARAEVDADGTMSVQGWSAGFQAMKAQGGPAVGRERAIELPGWHGGTVPSSFMFGLFHRWFEEQLGYLAQTANPPTVYNCTEGGAFIEGMVHVPFGEVACRLVDPIDVTATLDAAIDQVDVSARTKQIADHMAAYLLGLRRSRKLAQLALRLIERGQVENGRLARVERTLVETLKPLAFASLLASREVERAEDVARRTSSDATYLAASTALFTALVRVVDGLEPALAAARAAIRPRVKRKGMRRAA